MNPSQIKKIHPYDSIYHKNEHEVVALNIAVILAGTGDVFRKLSWEEYKERRLKDGNFTESEKYYFDAVCGHVATAGDARRFSPAWNIPE